MGSWSKFDVDVLALSNDLIQLPFASIVTVEPEASKISNYEM